MRSSSSWGVERRQKLKPNSHPAFPFHVIGERINANKQCPNVPAWSYFFLCVYVRVCVGECRMQMHFNFYIPKDFIK